MSTVKDTLNKLKATGEKAATSVKDGITKLSEMSKANTLTAKIKKYNPLFPDVYTDASFNIPNVVCIVDDAVRRNIDVCEGAIGWTASENGVEILFLYDESIEFSKLHFIPTVMCDSLYCVDPHRRDTFINIDCYFSYMQEAKLAELQNIAYCVGAKSYCVEMIESSSELLNKTKSSGSAFKGNKSKTDVSVQSEKHTTSASLAKASFSGEHIPSEPVLCWFSHDDNIKNLIAMRCSGKGNTVIREYSIELSGAGSASMSQRMAVKIEGAVKNLGASCDFGSKSDKEHSRKLIYMLEF